MPFIVALSNYWRRKEWSWMAPTITAYEHPERKVIFVVSGR